MTEAEKRKATPVFSGVLAYFPLTIQALAQVSLTGSKQHHPNEPMHWDRNKSTDHKDCCVRHLMDSGKIDTDGMRHSVKAAWRALANAELELEAVADRGGDTSSNTNER